MQEEVEDIKKVLFNLEKLIRPLLPTRITGDGKNRKPCEEYEQILFALDRLR